MSVTIVTCPRCNAQFKLRDLKLAGKKIKCRKCQSPFQVAMPDDEPEDDIVDDFTTDSGGDAESEFEEEMAPAPRRGTRQPRPLGKPLAAKRPIKKRKKQEVEEESEEEASNDGSQKRAIFAVIGVGALVAIGGIVFAISKLVGGGGGASLEVPQKFVRYDELNSPLMFEYPEGWAAKHGGGTGGIPPWVKIEKGDITIMARDSIIGQSMGVLANPSGVPQDGQPADELDPVHAVHIFQREKLMREEEGYEESPPEVFQTKMGEARIAEFKKPKTLGWSYGYRATLPPSTKQFTVTCTCSKSEFEQLKETFRKIIASMTFGRRG